MSSATPRWRYKPANAPWRGASETLRDLILELGYQVVYVPNGFHVVTPREPGISDEEHATRDREIRDRIAREYSRRMGGYDVNKDPALRVG